MDVSKTHIDLLVQALYKYERVPEDITPDELGKLLWRENHRSVNYRYGEKHRTPKYRHDSMAVCYGAQYSTPFHIQMSFDTVASAVSDPHYVYKQACCYRYQSCEHPQWEKSQVHAYINALIDACCKSTGLSDEAMRKTSQWDTFPWGVE